MYNYPYGDNQQINLNWIISEIIALHRQLDPDYTAPSFTQIYPFSDTQQLNLDWILTELKALKDLAPTPPPTEEIDEIGQALIAGAYDADTSYQKNDYIVQDGKLYRANAATTGTFDPTKWDEVLLGNDLAIITRWADATNTYLNNLAASNVANDSDVTGSTVKDALNTLKNDVSGMSTDDIANESGVTGETATEALNNLNGAINSITPFDTTPTSGSSKGITSGAVATAFDMLKISGLDAYYNLSSLASYLGTLDTGYMAIVRIASSAASSFFESSVSLPTLCYCLKAVSTNAYFLAVSRDAASIGNINISTGTINYLYDLAIADNSLGLNSSISYPAYFTCGIWRTSSDGIINLQFPCTSLKESATYTTTSTISINLFLPGSADSAIQLLNKSITATNRITTDNIILQIAAENDVQINRMGFFSTRTIMTITAD